MRKYLYGLGNQERLNINHIKVQHQCWGKYSEVLLTRSTFELQDHVREEPVLIADLYCSIAEVKIQKSAYSIALPVTAKESFMSPVALSTSLLTILHSTSGLSCGFTGRYRFPSLLQAIKKQVYYLVDEESPNTI